MRMFKRWIKQIFGTKKLPYSRPKRTRLHLEILEDRITPNTYTVDNLSDSGAGSLRQALLDSNANGGANAIVFSGAATSGTITLASALPNITDNVTITGPGANALTVNGNNAFQIFVVNTGATVSISGLSISNGETTSAYGSGIENFGTLTLTGCTFTADTAQAGGAVSNSGTLTVSGSTFTNNTSTQYGGGALENFGTLILSGSTFSGNSSANSGGAVEIGGGSASFTSCTFNNNTAGAAGGALCNNSGGSMSVADCTLVGNQAGYGGGITSSGTLAVSSTTITGNSTVANTGGGVNIASGTASLLNTIVVGNTNGTESTSTPDDISGTLDAAESQYNLIGTGGSGGLTNGVSNNQVGVSLSAADLMPLENNGGSTQTVGLLPGSPAQGTGTTTLTQVAAGNSLAASGATATFTVADPTFLAVGMVIAIGSEQMDITTVSGSAVTVTRAVNGTTEASHSAGATVYLPSDERGIARQNDIGACSPTPVIVVTIATDPSGTHSGESLRDAVTQANTDAAQGIVNTITFATNLSGSTITLANGVLALTGSMNIQGGNVITISGGGVSQIFSISSGATVSLSGLSIIDGTSTGPYGGGIASNGVLTVSDCTFTGNSARAGGAISNNAGTVTVLASTFNGNSSTVYGGGAIENFGTTLVSNSTLYGNTAATNGGAIESSAGSLTVSFSTITNNQAPANDGGGIAISNSANPASIVNTILVGNYATGNLSTPNDVSGSVNTGESQFNLIGSGPANSSSMETVNNHFNVSTSAAGLMVLGNYGGPTETVALLPGSAALNAGNNYLANLAVNVTASATTLTVNDATLLAAGMVMQIDSEEMYVESVNASTDQVTVQRGYNNTTPASHTANTEFLLSDDQRGITRANTIGAYVYQGYTPSIIDSAYGINLLPSGDDGAGQTIAIIDGGDDPAFVDSTAPNFDTSDLHIFDQEFGLPDPPSFLKVSATGGSTAGLPSATSTAETALDVEWAHAIAPLANIILVETTSSNYLQGIDWAAAPTAQGGGGATVISMSFTSYGGYAGETSNDPDFNPANYPGCDFCRWHRRPWRWLPERG